jgi:hypothetical protein
MLDVLDQHHQTDGQEEQEDQPVYNEEVWQILPQRKAGAELPGNGID